MPIRKSRVSGVVPSGTTADRPSNPSIGDTFFNGTLGVQEIYTTSGWLPATGANDFNVVLTGSETAVTLDKEYFSGAYTITSALSDNTFDLYLFDTSNNAAGYTKTPSVNATSNFNKVVVYGGTSGDLLSFAYKTTFTTATSTTDTFAAPYITSISVADLPNIDDTTTITGGNFDTDIEVWFDGQNDYSEQAKSVVYGSSTSVVATRPDNLLKDNSPYTIRVVNPGITDPAGSEKHLLVDSVTAGLAPIWSTSAGSLKAVYHGSPLSITLSASDPENSAVTYSIVSGQLPAGLSLNSSTGEISGDSQEGSDVLRSFTIRATDASGNFTDRDFSLGLPATGGTVTESGSYIYHTFTSSSTFQALSTLTADVLVVAGGGGGAGGTGGGGGAGGLINQSVSITPSSYAITVGSGGAAGPPAAAGTSGINSEAFGLTALGGGYAGGTSSSGEWAAASGGSGGGSGCYSGRGTAAGGSGTQPGSASGGFGNAGGNNTIKDTTYAGGGGGGAGAVGENVTASKAGDGGIGLQFPDWATATNTGENGYYAGGGGGAANGVYGLGGEGGGADASPTAGVDASSALINTGGGGGSSFSWGSGSGGAGGSGVVIIRYPV